MLGTGTGCRDQLVDIFLIIFIIVLVLIACVATKENYVQKNR